MEQRQMTYREETVQCYSDTFKELNGFRPNLEFVAEATDEQLDAELRALYALCESEEEYEDKIRAENHKIDSAAGVARAKLKRQVQADTHPTLASLWPQ